MDDQVEINLTTPIQGHNGPIDKVVLRAPRLADIFALGEPAAYGARDGVIFTAENPDVIKGYLVRLLVSPDALLVERVSATDAYRIKDALMGFLSAARLGASKSAQTS